MPIDARLPLCRSSLAIPSIPAKIVSDFWSSIARNKAFSEPYSALTPPMAFTSATRSSRVWNLYRKFFNHERFLEGIKSSQNRAGAPSIATRISVTVFWINSALPYAKRAAIRAAVSRSSSLSRKTRAAFSGSGSRNEASNRAYSLSR